MVLCVWVWSTCMSGREKSTSSPRHLREVNSISVLAGKIKGQLSVLRMENPLSVLGSVGEEFGCLSTVGLSMVLDSTGSQLILSLGNGHDKTQSKHF